MKPSPARIWLPRLLLALVLVLAVLRLGGFVLRFAHQSLQMDFSAFYTAGESLNHGLSPYSNNYRAGIWDGTDGYSHSRFLYPPLVAALFQPVARLAYATAKLGWMLLSLAALALALWMSVRAAGAEGRVEALLAVGLCAALFYPLLTMLERGQIDAVTLALVVGAAWALSPRRPSPPATGWRGLAGGALLAAAALLKLNIAFAAAFLVLRRQWWALLGCAAAAAVLLGVSIAAVGPGLVSDYVHRELPRIERYGEGGPGALPPSALRPLLAGVPRGQTRKDGRTYSPASFGFVANATLVRIPAVQRRFPSRSISRLSAKLLGAALVAMGVLEAVLRLRGVPRSGEDEFAYWNAVFMIVLLTGPLTWVMNVVWMLPAAAVVVGQYRRLDNVVQAAGLSLCALGLLWAALPDVGAFSMLLAQVPHWKILGDPWKYPAAELAVLAGLLLTLAAAPGGARTPVAVPPEPA